MDHTTAEAICMPIQFFYFFLVNPYICCVQPERGLRKTWHSWLYIRKKTTKKWESSGYDETCGQRQNALTRGLNWIIKIVEKTFGLWVRQMGQMVEIRKRLHYSWLGQRRLTSLLCSKLGFSTGKIITLGYGGKQDLSDFLTTSSTLIWYHFKIRG